MTQARAALSAADSEPPATEREFHWRGGRTSLDLTATVDSRGQGAVEWLRDPADLSRWFREAGLTEHHIPVSRVELAQARALREAVRRIAAAAREATAPEARDLDLLNQWTARPLPGTGLTLDEGGAPRPLPPALDARGLLGLLARDAADLLGGPLAGRIRECAAPACTLLFVDESRAGVRRWCSMDACGARAKMAEYRARKRGGTTTGSRGGATTRSRGGSRPD
ncbi:CGNR zinc finger domain-containing protein [Streptomyces flavofungini]|uniref:CGNR zinc finger domain-containing protein n=1 Tax=Streptomyces flavofungini TaxID=68200 RepID=UPI0025B01B17|nr:ABATE domain-containing protein [Streptomyces flavofungini]WJV50688.1 ABATE domain-containing protein [Streptomyces flavofungini]